MLDSSKNKQHETSEPKFNWVSIKLVIIISFVFLLQLTFPQSFVPFILDSSKVIFQPWTLITYIFLHGSFSHLISNMFALALFGSILEKVIGHRNFLKVFFFSGVLSGMAGLPFYSSMIGASGSVFGIMGVLAAIRPKMMVPAFGVPMYMILAIAIYAALDMGGIFFPDNVAHIGHLSALFFGIFIGLVWRKKYQIVEKKRDKRYEISDEEFREWEDKYMRRKLKRRGELIVFDDG